MRMVNNHLSGPEVRVLEVIRDEPLHLILCAGVQVLVSQPHSEWLPDGYCQIFRFYEYGPSGLKDYSSATLRCKI